MFKMRLLLYRRDGCIGERLTASVKRQLRAAVAACWCHQGTCYVNTFKEN